MVNGAPVPVSYVDAQTLTAMYTPISDGALKIEVQQDGQQAAYPLQVRAVSAFPRPRMQYVDPNLFDYRNHDKSITIFGELFRPGAVGKWDGQVRATTFVSETEIVMMLTDADMQALGGHTVTISNPDPSDGDSSGATVSITQLPAWVELQPHNPIGLEPTIVGTPSQTKYLVMDNKAFGDTSFTFTHSLNIKVESDCGAYLPAKQACRFALQMTPTSTAREYATLDISSPYFNTIEAQLQIDGIDFSLVLSRPARPS